MIRAMHEEHSGKSHLLDQAPARAGQRLVERIRDWGAELGFAAVGVTGTDVSAAATGLRRWLAAGRQGEMDYMAKHAELRAEPQAVLPGARSTILVALPYWPHAAAAEQVLTTPGLAYVSRYALGRDYHKTLRQRLQKLAERITAGLAPDEAAHFACRVFTDSAPVFEVELARQAGFVWRGKHTLSLNRHGSWHFLGGMYTTLELPHDAAQDEHCGTCTRCLEACPTRAIVAPYEVDARRCISYLTIELRGAIPEELRPLVGRRIYGCDDCQLRCPWNRFARLGDPDFSVRQALDAASLVALFAWSASDFDTRLAGSPIRRIGHERWLRNLAVALGNTPTTPEILAALANRQDDPSLLVREHVAWALQRHAGTPGTPHSAPAPDRSTDAA